jgi:ArsR family transcriptional regulator, arsenate/arsenite/antimonite-responsive transcriptional repressor
LTGRRYFHIIGNMKSTKAIEALAALAQETRLSLFRLLVEQGPQGLAAGEIGDKLRIPAPTLSFHLAQLARAGLVSSRREGRSIIYAADFSGMNGLIAYLTENCCGAKAGCAPAVQSVPISQSKGASSHEAPARRARGR